MKIAILIILTAVILLIGVRSCQPAVKQTDVSGRKSTALREEKLPVLAQNQVPENPHVSSVPSGSFPEAPNADSKDSFKAVSESESLKNTPYGKHQV